MMFTGIIKEMGTVTSLRDRGYDREFAVSSELLAGSINIGDSISVNGVCLTVKDLDGNNLLLDVSSNTLKLSNLGSLKAGDQVNLEDSLSTGDKLGGHFVSGHVDAVAVITGISASGRSYEVTFNLGEGIRSFITARGSIAIDGISLTVTEVTKSSFKTVIIPHTYKNTTLGRKDIGDTVNVEVDMLARYIVNYLSRKEPEADPYEKDRTLREKLEKNGFIR